MICLFFDTSSEKLNVSLVKDDNVLYEKQIETQNDHSSYLVPYIDEAFKKNNINFKDVDRIIVGIGPGSFTGTRIAITVAKTYGYTQNIPIFGISSLETMIYENNGYDYYVPVIEDKNDKLYFSIFDKDKKRVIDDMYASKDELYDTLSKYNGNILIISHKGEKYDNYQTKEEVINVVNINKNILINNKEVNPHLLKPNYIKKIEAESKL